MGDSSRASSSPPLAQALNASPLAAAPADNGASATSMTTDNEAGASTPEAAPTNPDNTLKPAESPGDLPEDRPPLPPRPPLLQTPNKTSGAPRRPSLQSKATTALSSIDIQTLTFPDGSRGTFSSAAQPSPARSASTSGKSAAEIGRKPSGEVVDSPSNTSIASQAPTLRAGFDLESLLGESLNDQSPAWKLLSGHSEPGNPFENIEFGVEQDLANFEHEFDEVAEVDIQGGNEEELLEQWKSKLKHYMILSSAGKPIYSRHGDQNLINGYIGIVQTIISFYEGAKDPLKGFTAGGARFVIYTDGPLYFVAISRLGESDAQLRAQLQALYMQILSTLTLPTLLQLFKNRPSTDLSRPLHGTEPLLSSLADTFTKGSPSALLSALECLKIRKSQRHLINNTLLKTRSDKLLYGLIVAGGRLVSVVRPKRHSLHPSDLQLIFNMLFEAGSVKAGGGENWIPICLPGFNNKGYLYMYVSFLSAFDENGDTIPEESETPKSARSSEEEIVVLLISPDKESFFELRQMRDDLVDQLKANGSMEIIERAVQAGRPSTTDLVPGTQLLHFLYKSRANVQFVMPSFEPHFDSLISRRRLMSLYHNIHASAHAKHSHLKVLHCLNRDSIALAWITPLFEFYCVAGPNASRSGLAQGANRIIQWVKREEERVFIIGGAVF